MTRRPSLISLLVCLLALPLMQSRAAAQPGGADDLQPPPAEPAPAPPAPNRAAPTQPAYAQPMHARQPMPMHYTGYHGTRTERYGLLIALADVLSIASGYASDSGEAFTYGYLFGGPTVHLLKGNTSAAWKSGGLRVLAPVGGLFIASAMCESDSDSFDCLGYGILGVGAGMLGAMIFDWTVLAKKDIAVPPPTGVRVAPGIMMSKEHVGIGLNGLF